MNVIDNARAALAEFDRDQPDYRSELQNHVDLGVALRALIAEYERVTAPPTDDEREALLDGAWQAISGRGDAWGGCAERDKVIRVADFAAGFRRRGPITSEMVEQAARAIFAEEQCDRAQKATADLLAANWRSRLSDQDQAEYRSLARVALEAAGAGA